MVAEKTRGYITLLPRDYNTPLISGHISGVILGHLGFHGICRRWVLLPPTWLSDPASRPFPSSMRGSTKIAVFCFQKPRKQSNGCTIHLYRCILLLIPVADCTSLLYYRFTSTFNSPRTGDDWRVVLYFAKYRCFNDKRANIHPHKDSTFFALLLVHHISSAPFTMKMNPMQAGKYILHGSCGYKCCY